LKKSRTDFFNNVLLENLSSETLGRGRIFR